MLPAGSQLTVLPALDYHASSPYIHAPQPRPTNVGPDLLRHLRLHRGAKYIHSPHPDRVRDPVVRVVISELLVLVQTECDDQSLVHTPPTSSSP
ncbi:hypothetical protein BASA60_009343 [Batrachochytrium salamandrivorans]|nr:hypothetical protein BASA60_009343 [Batrachochytrium salamandrivorans]